MTIDKEIRATDFDAIDYLDTEDAVVEYLNAALSTGDSKLVSAALGDIARSKGISKISRETNVSRDCLYKSLNGDGNPTVATFFGIVNALNLSVSVKNNDLTKA